MHILPTLMKGLPVEPEGLNVGNLDLRFLCDFVMGSGSGHRRGRTWSGAVRKLCGA